MPQFTINASVGKEGINVRADVIIIQQLLTDCGFHPGPVDGSIGSKTIAAIMAFQRTFLRHPDGRVDVGGTTWRKLVATDRAAVVVAPSVAAGDWSGDSSQWPQEKKLQSLDADFRPKVVKVLQALKQRGFKPKIFFGWRSVAVQLELVRKGRSKVRFSFHNAQRQDGTPNAYAVDVIDRRWGWNDEAEKNGFWDALGEEGKKLGLVWGGDWTGFRDVAHLQSRQNNELAQVKRESGL